MKVVFTITKIKGGFEVVKSYEEAPEILRGTYFTATQTFVFKPHGNGFRIVKHWRIDAKNIRHAVRVFFGITWEMENVTHFLNYKT